MPELPPPAVVAPVAVAGPAIDLTGYRAVPFVTSRTGHLLVRGEVNGRPVDVLIDSGSTTTIVDRDWAVGAGIALSASKDRAYGAGGANLVLQRAGGARLTIGGVTIPGLELLALDLSGVVANMQLRGASAPRVILGSDVLARHGAVLDYVGRRLWLGAAR